MFKFSFSNKTELIYFNNKPYISPIGSLLMQLIDVNWQEIETIFRESNSVQEIKILLNETISHPVMLQTISEINEKKALLEQLNRASLARKNLLHILEALVDEEQNAYEEQLFNVMTNINNEEIISFFSSLGVANILPIDERNKPIYHNTADFPFIFSTNELLSIVIQELQYICTNHFYIRKCAFCKSFFFTRKTNQTYCNRLVAETNKTCGQMGPFKIWQDKSTKAYSFYWNYRCKLFNRGSEKENDTRYHEWVRLAEPYRNLAKEDKIQLKEMKEILDKIESKVYEVNDKD